MQYNLKVLSITKSKHGHHVRHFANWTLILPRKGIRKQFFHRLLGLVLKAMETNEFTTSYNRRRSEVICALNWTICRKLSLIVDLKNGLCDTSGICSTNWDIKPHSWELVSLLGSCVPVKGFDEWSECIQFVYTCIIWSTSYRWRSEEIIALNRTNLRNCLLTHWLPGVPHWRVNSSGIRQSRIQSLAGFGRFGCHLKNSGSSKGIGTHDLCDTHANALQTLVKPRSDTTVPINTT